jgi:SagB-type dehydrogenase family enzyme
MSARNAGARNDDDGVLRAALAAAGLQLTAAQEFHQATKLRRVPPDTPTSDWPEEWTRQFYKAYPRLPVLPLSAPPPLPSVSLETALRARRSRREFSDLALDEPTLSTLLFYSAGIADPQRDPAHRFYPSAGARFPLELYPVVLNVEGWPPGLYHYYPKAHALEALTHNKRTLSTLTNALSGTWFRRAAVILLMTAVFYRTEVKYRDRGYRHVMVESGCMMQNIYLVAEALGLACSTHGGFVDDRLHDYIDVDGIEEAVIAVLCAGHRPAFQ